MKYQALLAVCLITFSAARSQMMMDSSHTFDPDKGIQFYVGLGGAYNNYENLDAIFKDAGLPTVGKFSLISSMELDLRNKSFLIGLKGNMGASYKRPDNYNVMLLNFGEQLHLAYYVANNKNFHFAPQVGIGYMSSHVNVTQRDNIDDFNDVLANGNSIDINQGTGVLDFCLRFDFADFTKPGSKAASIQAGYKLGLSRRGWGIDAFNNSTIDNSPKDRIGQIYLLFSIGFAGQKPIKNK